MTVNPALFPAETIEAKYHAAAVALAEREEAREQLVKVTRLVLQANAVQEAAGEQLIAAAKKSAEATQALKDALL